MSQKYLYLAWALALVGFLGTLTVPQILGYAPCPLCWYQRMFMWSLALVLGIGLWRHDREVYWYGLPLVFLGLAAAGYHSLLQWGMVPESTVICGADSSCAVKQLELFGFVTLPFMSFLLFAGISVLLLKFKQKGDSQA